MYTLWSVMAGETPTEAKWNILGENDAEFNAMIQRNVAGTGVKLIDSSGNEILIGNRVASAVNEVSVTNAATAGVPKIEATGGDTNIHIQVSGKGNGLMKCSVLRQDDTTNSYKHNSVMLTGWGVLAISTGARTFSETVNFGITFAAKPIVISGSGGDNTSNGGYGSGGNVISADWMSKATSINAGNFTQYLVAPNNMGANGFGWYQWIAVGEL